MLQLFLKSLRQMRCSRSTFQPNRECIALITSRITWSFLSKYFTFLVNVNIPSTSFARTENWKCYFILGVWIWNLIQSTFCTSQLLLAATEVLNSATKPTVNCYSLVYSSLIIISHFSIATLSLRSSENLLKSDIIKYVSFALFYCRSLTESGRYVDAGYSYINAPTDIAYSCVQSILRRCDSWPIEFQYCTVLDF